MKAIKEVFVITIFFLFIIPIPEYFFQADCSSPKTPSGISYTGFATPPGRRPKAG